MRIKFTDNSQITSEVSEWHWDFGDGQSSTETNPEHTFTDSGMYVVKLTVTDQSNQQDTFERLIEVSEDYCAIGRLSTDSQIRSVSIGGNEINYSATEWDYTQTPIELADPKNMVINIKGDSEDTQYSTRWKVWIDLNDNGIFGDDSDELVVNEFAAEGQPYALLINPDLSGLQNDGSAKYMRVIGNYAVNTPCSGNVGEALDLRVSW